VTAVGVPGLRPAGPDDAEVLHQVYASTREEELSVVPWDAATKEAFLRMQFAAQDTYYRSTYPDASYDLIVDGAEVLGRLYVDRGEVAWLVIDLALLPEHRGNGLGTRLLRGVLADAAGAVKPVHMHVEQFNPARRLYDRLGFYQIAEQGIYLLLEWVPGPDESALPHGVVPSGVVPSGVVPSGAAPGGVNLNGANPDSGYPDSGYPNTAS
jgi:ribosomal protein S18 acetylase RimI-like enzyme